MSETGQTPDLVVLSRRIVTPDGIVAGGIQIVGGRISAVGPIGSGLRAGAKVDVGDQVVFPGLVDTHVHVNEPGRTTWEGFTTATRAAAAGGVTTLFDMPLNSVPATTTTKALEKKRRIAARQVFIDVGFWGGVVPGNTGELAGMKAAGVPGFKCFLVPSGVQEFPYVQESHLREAMPVLAELDAVLLVHAESPGPIDRAAAAAAASDPSRYETWLHSRPIDAELEAIMLMIDLAREFETRIHIVHLPNADAIAPLADAQRAGVAVTSETCPHYLYFDAAEIADGATEFKCAPPIRDGRHGLALWKALEAGPVGMVVSDHSPCPPAMKLPGKGDFMEAWGGIASLQLGLPIVWTLAAERGVDLPTVAEWMCAAPARLAGLGDRKGKIAPGYDADLVCLDPERVFTVDGARLEHRHKVTPYQGETLQGVVNSTYVRGRRVFSAGLFPGAPEGQLL